MLGGTPRASKLYGLNDLVFHEPLTEEEGEREERGREGRERKRERAKREEEEERGRGISRAS